ncbi:MAG: Bug family tripartite tricarboxylate transporter substrate binding protein [Burkholderiales bacterium]
MQRFIRGMGLALSGFAAAASAQNFPDRPLRIIVAFSSGTAADIVARQIAIKLTESLGKQVIVENRDGGAGTIGAAAAARATPDGYTMFIASTSVIVSPMIIKDVPYDVFRDFAPVSLLAVFPTVLISNPQFKANSVRELIELAKASPGKLNYATAGKGTASDLGMALIRSMTGIQLVEVPYRANAQALNDTMSGEVAVYMPNLAAALPNIKAGRLKALAVTSAKRSSVAPEIPTVAETLPGYEAASWYGIVVPAKTPKPVIAKLHAEIGKVLQLPDVQQRLQSLGGDIVAGGPEDLGRTMKQGADKWGKLIRDSEARP